MPFVNGQYVTEESLSNTIVIPNGLIKFQGYGHYRSNFNDLFELDLARYGAWVVKEHGEYLAPDETLLSEYLASSDGVVVLMNAIVDAPDDVRASVSGINITVTAPPEENKGMEPLF